MTRGVANTRSLRPDIVEAEPAQARAVVANASLREQVYSALKAMLIAGELEQDGLYSVTELADRFSISRTPAREALLELAHQGFLRAERNRGFRVVRHSEAELQDAFHVRLLLESEAMTRAARKPPSRAALADARAGAAFIKKAAETAQLVDYLVTDREFHLRLVALGGNVLLTRLWAIARDHMRLPGLRALASHQDRLAASVQEHFDLLRALESGDVTAVRRITRSHIERSRAEWVHGPR